MKPMASMSWRERAAAQIQAGIVAAQSQGLEGAEVRDYVRSHGPGPNWPSFPRRMWLEEFAREFKGKRSPVRGQKAIKPAAGQGELF